VVGRSAGPGEHSNSPVARWIAKARGWRADVGHSADGPDRTRFAFVRDGVICMFQGRWDGGHGTDPTVKPDDADKGAGHCAANNAEAPGLPDFAL
jgi:hypothetical protein